MDLHSALLFIGISLIILVFIISRYVGSFSGLKDKFFKAKEKMQRADGIDQAANIRRDADHAPRFGASEAQALADDSPLFDYTQDEIQADSQENILLSSSEQPLEAQHQADLNLQATDAQALEANTLSTEPEPEPQAAERIEAPNGPFTSLRQIDYWMKLSPAVSYTQAQFLEQFQGLNEVRFPVQLHGLIKDESKWIDLSESAVNDEVALNDIVASYQLIDRGEATSLEDLNRFDDIISTVAEQLDAEKLMMATTAQAQAHSESLAQFYQDSYAPIEVKICAPKDQSFMGKLVETSAKQQGLEYAAGDYVRMKRMVSENVVLYRMTSDEAGGFKQDMPSSASIRCVTFSMHPTQSITPGRDAKEMLDAVKAFASRVKGDIRIPGKQEYRQEQLLELRNQVSKFEETLNLAGLKPGGQ
ncbi:MAG: cell division protein ZipA C-terminal FtsZ-binding domain-containing protein [Arenicellales bacterium]